MATQQGFSTGIAAWRRLLKNKNVAWLWVGQAVSQIGDGLSKVALLWFVYDLTGSALKMTMIGILQTVPPLLFGPFVGVLLDRVPKRLAMIVIDSVRAVFLFVIPSLYWMGMLTLPGLYVLVFVTAMFSTAFGPALKAMEPLLVESDQLTQINALDQSTMTVGQLLGPAISGMLIAIIGAQNVLFVNAGTFLISALCKIPLKIEERLRRTKRTSPMHDAWIDLKEGIGFVFGRKRLMVLLMGVASVFTLGTTAFIYLLPVLAKDHFHLNSVELGWLWASLSIGLLVVTVWMIGASPKGLCLRLWMIAAAAALGGIAMFGLTIMNSFPLAALLIVVIGASSGVVNPFVSASLQEQTPKYMMARVFSVFNTGTLVAAMVGMTVCGYLADSMGPAISLAATAAVNVAAAIVTVAVIPFCQRLQSHGARARVVYG
ncbi:Permease, MFS family [Nitrospira sp. KM1]|uniref:MFS transporter n=1 Tax=Nitrospira sp. KM1 TaxID=1936990 RepID=UPI0013A78DFF|nr:MFS transporter [Nitrospira sp. KM1]BCA56503.1 Permease, MFS family [Nitrospira sp. KM1]